MRRTSTIWLLAGMMIAALSACNKAAPLNRSASDVQAIVEGPATEAKTDRPTETGEGLPGYLIDPAKLAITSQDKVWTISGLAGAVRSVQGESAALPVWLIKVSKRTASFDKQDKNWVLSGTKIASINADAQGAFRIQGSIGADDLLFVKLEDSSGSKIAYKSGITAQSVLWIDGSDVRPIDGAQAERISTQVSEAQAGTTTLSRAIEQLKITGQCRNCNLAGADLSGLQIAGCDLSFSNLMKAQFTLSNVSGCNFTNSNLAQADFTQANLAGANFTQTDISGAIFTGASVDGIVGRQIPAP